jgi:hypothetical protein
MRRGDVNHRRDPSTPTRSPSTSSGSFVVGQDDRGMEDLVRARVGESIARSAKIAKHRRNWKQLLPQRSQRNAEEDRDIRRYRENSLMRHGKGHSVGALRLRANDRLWKYILAALRSG